MKITDIKCDSCGAGDKRVETVSLRGSSTKRQLNCVCGTVIESLDSPNLITYHLITYRPAIHPARTTD